MNIKGLDPWATSLHIDDIAFLLTLSAGRLHEAGDQVANSLPSTCMMHITLELTASIKWACN